MKKVLMLSAIFVLSACGSNDDGSSKSTYSSCKITSSNALFQSDKDNDLSQCWNAGSDGYESQGDAMQWCEQKVTSYISSNYVIGHSVNYAIESTYCK